MPTLDDIIEARNVYTHRFLEDINVSIHVVSANMEAYPTRESPHQSGSSLLAYFLNEFSM